MDDTKSNIITTNPIHDRYRTEAAIGNTRMQFRYNAKNPALPNNPFEPLSNSNWPSDLALIMVPVPQSADTVIKLHNETILNRMAASGYAFVRYEDCSINPHPIKFYFPNVEEKDGRAVIQNMFLMYADKGSLERDRKEAIRRYNDAAEGLKYGTEDYSSQSSGKRLGEKISTFEEAPDMTIEELFQYEGERNLQDERRVT